MPKLTVFFKNKAIDSCLFENGVVRIGSDETNDLKIDSLAIAPAHATVFVHNGISTIKQLNDDFPLIVNGMRTKEYALNNNDMITLGKHDLLYHSTEVVLEPSPDNPTEKHINPFNHNIDQDSHTLSAGLQVMNGPNIGKLHSLKKAMTRLGQNGSGVVIIAKRKDGYFMSILENSGNITVNNKPLNDGSIKLQHKDVLAINGTSLQFFLF